VGFDVIDRLLIKRSEFIRHCKKSGSTMGQYIRYLFVYFEKAYDSVK
jgi:hypothetical protein